MKEFCIIVLTIDLHWTTQHVRCVHDGRAHDSMIFLIFRDIIMLITKKKHPAEVFNPRQLTMPLSMMTRPSAQVNKHFTASSTFVRGMCVGIVAPSLDKSRFSSSVRTIPLNWNWKAKRRTMLIACHVLRL